MENISIFYLFLILTSLSSILSGRDNLLKECEQQDNSFSLICQDDLKISSNGINSSLLVDFKGKLKLKGINSLQLINSLDEINLMEWVSVDKVYERKSKLMSGVPKPRFIKSWFHFQSCGFIFKSKQHGSATTCICVQLESLSTGEDA